MSPCNMVAVVSSKLTVDPKVIAESELGTKAFGQVVAKSLNLPLDEVQVQKVWKGLQAYRYPWTVTLRDDGELQVVNSLGYRYQSQMEELKAALEKAIPELCGLLVQRKVTDAIKAKFGNRVTQTQRLSSGAVSFKLNL